MSTDGGIMETGSRCDQVRDGHVPGETVVPVGAFALTFAIVASWLYARHRADAQRHTTLRMMVERGTEIGPELLNPRRGMPDLRRAILLMATGLGIGLFMAACKTLQGAAIGLVPFTIGLGYLLLWMLGRRRDADGR